MRKLIDIPEDNKILEKLQIKAIIAKKDLKNYIQDLLIEHANKEVLECEHLHQKWVNNLRVCQNKDCNAILSGVDG